MAVLSAIEQTSLGGVLNNCRKAERKEPGQMWTAIPSREAPANRIGATD